MVHSEIRIEESSFLLFTLENLIPGESDLSLPSAAEIIYSDSEVPAELKLAFEPFFEAYKEFIIKKDTTTHDDADLLVEFANSGTPESIPYLTKLLELYYTDHRILSKYPDSAGVVFPESRKMLQIDLEILEPVIEQFDTNRTNHENL
jgi:hypothetical protein